MRILSYKSVKSYRDQLFNLNASLASMGIKPRLIKGCKGYQSGFFKIQGHFFYFCFTPETAKTDKALWRLAKGFQDYTGGENQWCKAEEIAERALAFVDYVSRSEEGVNIIDAYGQLIIL